MNIKNVLRIFIVSLTLLTTLISHGQEKTMELSGIVQHKNKNIADVLIINLNSKQATITNTKGYFMIETKLKDTLLFSAVQYIKKKIIITDTILKQNTPIIDLEEKVINLDEVVILPNNLTGQLGYDLKGMGIRPGITSSSLGLPKAKMKVNTKNERLLFAADDGYLVKLKGSIRDGVGISINVTKLISGISGNTKKLKNRVKLDRYAVLEEQVASLFSKTTWSEALGIPNTAIDDFLGFCVSQSDFPKSPETTNALLMLNYIKSKCNEYKKANGLD